MTDRQMATHAAHNVYTLPYRRNQLKYMHQTLINPPMETLIKAIENEQLEGFPFMKTKMVRKYLAPSPATSKGRMKRSRAGIRSTRKNVEAETTTDMTVEVEPVTAPGQMQSHVIPDDNEGQISNVFCYAALADKISGTLYTDATGALPVRSINGYQYYFVAYDYDTNYIFPIPIKDVTDASIIEAFQKVFEELKEQGYQPKFNVTDNQATRPLKKFLKTKQC